MIFISIVILNFDKNLRLDGYPLAFDWLSAAPQCHLTSMTSLPVYCHCNWHYRHGYRSLTFQHHLIQNPYKAIMLLIIDLRITGFKKKIMLKMIEKISERTFLLINHEGKQKILKGNIPLFTLSSVSLYN